MKKNIHRNKASDEAETPKSPVSGFETRTDFSPVSPHASSNQIEVSNILQSFKVMTDVQQCSDSPLIHTKKTFKYFGELTPEGSQLVTPKIQLQSTSIDLTYSPDKPHDPLFKKSDLQKSG